MASPGWIAIAAFLISISTFCKTLYGDWRAHRGKALAKFEADYGTPIRTGLRAYEKALSTLRAYTVTSGRTLRILKKEIEVERARWIEAADEMARLLDEADTADALTHPGWGKRFREKAEAGEERMLSMTEPAIADVDALKTLAKETHEGLVQAIRDVRTSLREELSSYDRIGQRRRRT